MVRVITYGTFDLFHAGHRRLLERARALGDRLIVGVTADGYDESRGKLNVRQTLMERIENVRSTGLAHEILVEEYEGQKVRDVLRLGVDVFAIGSDWVGRFDYLNEYCRVVYLERTRGISSTQLRDETAGVLRIGIVGLGRIANRFVEESKFVSGVSVEGCCGRRSEAVEAFVSRHALGFGVTDYEAMLERVDAVYVATPHATHYDLAHEALMSNRHVLCEKPATLSAASTERLYDLAFERKLVFLEAIKTAYAPAFQRMIAIAKSGSIGEIVHVDATFTKLVAKDGREYSATVGAGSVAELGSYPLLAAVKLLGREPVDVRFLSRRKGEPIVDSFTRIDLAYPSAAACLKVGIGVKAEGDLVVAGTNGYLYVPAPWWRTEYFEARFEDSSNNRKYYAKYDGDGLRYEIAEWSQMVSTRRLQSHLLTRQDSVAIARIQDLYRGDLGVRQLG